MSSSRHPWPGLARELNDPKGGPATANPQFEEQLARDRAEAEAHLRPITTATPPPPATPAASPVEPPTPVPPDAGAVKLGVFPRLIEGKHVLVVSPYPADHADAYSDAEKAALRRFKEYGDWHNNQVRLELRNARDWFFAEGAGLRYREAKARHAETAAEVARLGRELAEADAAWTTAVQEGRDQDADQQEAERDRLTKLRERAGIRVKVHAEAVATLKGEAEAGLKAAVVAARDRYQAAAAGRMKQAAAELAEAVVPAWLKWFAAACEHDSAVAVGGISRHAQNEYGRLLDVDRDG